MLWGARTDMTAEAQAVMLVMLGLLAMLVMLMALAMLSDGQTCQPAALLTESADPF